MRRKKRTTATVRIENTVTAFAGRLGTTVMLLAVVITLYTLSQVPIEPDQLLAGAVAMLAGLPGTAIIVASILALMAKEVLINTERKWRDLERRLNLVIIPLLIMLLITIVVRTATIFT